MQTQPNNYSKNTEKVSVPYANEEMLLPKLMKLFEDELKDIYWAKKELTKTIPKMINKASSQELINVLELHFKETEEQVLRIEQIFESFGKKAVAHKSIAITSLINDIEAVMTLCDTGEMRDAEIIATGQKVINFEISYYRLLCQYAGTLGLNQAVKLLETTLIEEKEAIKKLEAVIVKFYN